jgi:hypothetical protein
MCALVCVGATVGGHWLLGRSETSSFAPPNHISRFKALPCSKSSPFQVVPTVARFTMASKLQVSSSASEGEACPPGHDAAKRQSKPLTASSHALDRQKQLLALVVPTITAISSWGCGGSLEIQGSGSPLHDLRFYPTAGLPAALPWRRGCVRPCFHPCRLTNFNHQPVFLVASDWWVRGR